MIERRKSARNVAILFLVALILNLIATELFNPLLNPPDYLTKVYTNKHWVVIGTLLNIICGIDMILIPICLLPVIPKEHKALGTLYTIFRALEGILFFILAALFLSFIGVSELYLDAIASDATVLILRI